MKKFLILGILACFIATNASADDGHFRKKHQAFSYSSMEMTGGDETLKSNFGFAFTSTGYMGYIVAGGRISYRFIGVGCEYRSGSGEMNDFIEGGVSPLEMTGFRAYISFSF